MSREILFRGRTKKGKWVKGDLVHGRYFTAINNRELELIPPQMIEVDPDTVCQYTGLIDKNGKKVFEEDIVYGRCNGLSGRGEIIWCNGGYAIDDKKRNRVYSLFNSDWTLRVDGNRWDNPELLEGGMSE